SHIYLSVFTKKDPVHTCSNPTLYFVFELFWKLNMFYFFVPCLFLCLLFFFVSWLFSKLKGVEEKPMSDNNAPLIKYDIFVSFRTQDINHGFLSHLTDTFERKKIDAFVDDKLERGDEIRPSLVGAIEGSFISLILFSQEYASSHWCFEELVTILECREKYGQIVIPVFYHVRPKNLNICLTVITFTNDADLVKEIVNLVLKRLAKAPVISKGLVGIDEKIAIVESWIRKEPKDTRFIGIWGMGVIGKTTLAEEVFNKLRSEYEGCYFLAHEREQSNRHGIVSLREKLFSELLGCDVKIGTPNSLPEIWLYEDHVEKLLGALDNLGSGSKIIVTTRDEKVFKTYQLREFSSDKVLELFNLNVFIQSEDQTDFNELSERVVNYGQGIPLVVKVLARLLRGKIKEEWESALDKLKRCLLHRRSKIFIERNESDNSVVFGLERLKDQALTAFSQHNFIYMHDSLQEMAWEIVCRESSEPGSRSRLWNPDDIYEALKSDKKCDF
ncbi:TMV resistance protein N, partial [Mucuna pruriens]